MATKAISSGASSVWGGTAPGHGAAGRRRCTWRNCGAYCRRLVGEPNANGLGPSPEPNRPPGVPSGWGPPMQTVTANDAELVKRVLSGDTPAFNALVERYANALCSLAYLKTGHADEARDIVQEAFLAAYRGLDTLADPARFRAWVRGIVSNLAHKHLDRRSRDQRLRETPAETSAPCDPAQDWDRRDAARQVRQVLERLDERHREVVLLHYFEDMRVEAIASFLRKPAGTVKRLLAEARAIAKRELVQMAHAESREYHLTSEERRRLAMIPTFPRVEPKVSARPLEEPAPEVVAVSPLGDFPPLRPGAEVCWAHYDHPGGKLAFLNHVVVQGPVEVDGSPAMWFDLYGFTSDGEVDSFYRAYYRLEGEAVILCAKQWGPSPDDQPVITPDRPRWRDALTRSESLRLVPGSCIEPAGGSDGALVDARLWAVNIGRRRHRCVRRVCDAGRQTMPEAEHAVTNRSNEEFYLPDGRLLLRRVYSGTMFGDTYESLAQAGMPRLQVFGETYYLWFDMVPNYAVCAAGARGRRSS